MHKPSYTTPINEPLLAIASALCLACLPGADDHEDAASDGSPTLSEGSDTSTDSGSTSTSDGDDGTTNETNEVEDCTPPIDTKIDVRLLECSSLLCDGVDLGEWAPLTHEIGALSATCMAAGTPIEFSPTKKRWVLEGCTGDEIPDDGRLALDWETSPAVEPLLSTNTPLSVELRRPRVGMHALSIRDSMGDLVALEISNYTLPSPDFSAPTTIEISTTLCELPPEPCIGPRRIHDVLIDDGAGNELMLGWGDQVLSGAASKYNILVRQAQSLPSVPCGEYADGGYFDLVITQ